MVMELTNAYKRLRLRWITLYYVILYYVFNYLGAILNADEKMNTEIAEKNSKMQQSILC
jgi:hypothetical protein